MMKNPKPTLISRPLILLITLVSLLSACGSDSKKKLETEDIVLAKSTELAISTITDGDSVFIKKLAFTDFDIEFIQAVSYVISPKTAAVAAPLTVTYSQEKISNDYIASNATSTVTLPVFGLYSDYDNQVEITVTYSDNSQWQQNITITTDAFVETSDGDAIYNNITINQLANAANKPSFSYFYLKNKLYSPMVFDIDGNIRWLLPEASDSDAAAYFDGQQFITGDTQDNAIYIQQFDGHQEKVMLTGGEYSAGVFHHNLEAGKIGMLAELDVTVNGIIKKEAYLAEILANGTVVKTWDLGEIFSDYMTNFGDDPSNFVRYSKPDVDGDGTDEVVDWFHMNSAIYDASDDSLIISSRENFVVKIDYQSGAIKWLLGDETKHWYQNYPSLRALAPTLSIGSAPIGAHALSIANDGSLMIFNNGYHSLHHPSDESAGINRDHSSASKYVIADDGLSYQETWSFDENKLSDICSSIYQHSSGDYLMFYASTAERTQARVVVLNDDKEVLVDFHLPTQGCTSGWNAAHINLENLVF